MKWWTISLFVSMLFMPIQRTFADTIPKQKQNTPKITLVKSDTLEICYGDTMTVSLNSDSTNYSTNEKFILNFQQQPKKRDYVNLILPIITLLLGFFLNRGYEYFNEKRKIVRSGERWIAELQGLEEPILSQKKSLEEFLENHSIDKFEPPQLEIHQILDCEIFKSLEKSDLLKFIKTREKNYADVVKVSNSVHGFISSMNFIYNDITSRFNEYLENTSKHVELFNEHLKQLNQSFGMFGVAIETETGKDPMEDKVFNQMYSLFHKYISPYNETGDIELFGLQKEFIMHLSAIVATYRANKDIQKIAIHLSNCNMEIKAIRMEKRYLSENFGKVIEYLVKSKNNLDNVIKSLNKSMSA